MSAWIDDVFSHSEDSPHSPKSWEFGQCGREFLVLSPPVWDAKITSHGKEDRCIPRDHPKIPTPTALGVSPFHWCNELCQHPAIS